MYNVNQHISGFRYGRRRCRLGIFLHRHRLRHSKDRCNELAKRSNLKAKQLMLK